MPKILCAGDSITQGSPNFKGGYLRTLANEANNLAFVGSQNEHLTNEPYLPHEGYSGGTIAARGATILSNIDTYTPEIVIVMFGTNEVTTGTEDVQELYDFAGDCLNKVSVGAVIVGNCVPRKSTEALYAEHIAYRAAINTKFLTTEAPLPSGMYFCDPGADFGDVDLADSVHPSEDGYIRIARTFRAALVDANIQLDQKRQGSSQGSMVF